MHSLPASVSGCPPHHGARHLSGLLSGCSSSFSASSSGIRGVAARSRRATRPAPPAATGRPSALSGDDLAHLQAAATLADSSAGVTAPHPNAACILVDADGRTLASAYQHAQGTTSAEVQAVQQARGAAAGATAYLNLESGDCHGDHAALDALLGAHVARVVVGLRHPLPHLRGQAIARLRARGVNVDVLRETECRAPSDVLERTARSCVEVNDALLHRAVLRRPLSTLKYAMTLDGKIATSTGHSAWVSSPQSRAIVFETRARSDAVIVGGNTVRRDNPRLTTRRDGGHLPVRIIMSRTLELPEEAELWDVSVAPTIVLTQRGARRRFQTSLRQRGVEVVEFDFLTPEGVADYCYERGFLQCLWECGGTLAAPCISSGVVHRVMAFVAPKIIGGVRAPTPVGDLGFVEMTQAVDVLEPSWQQVGPDLFMRGYLPSSGGPEALEATLWTPPLGGTGGGTLDFIGGTGGGTSTSAMEPSPSNRSSPTSSPIGGSATSAAHLAVHRPGGLPAKQRRRASRHVASFYKAWDKWGALSNFSPHPIVITAGGANGSSTSATGSSSSTNGNGTAREWRSVEHYYQAQKFHGLASPTAAALVEAVSCAPSPEEAARIGRRAQVQHPELMREDWQTARLDVMLTALRAKFQQHAGPREMLLATAGVSPTGVDSASAAAAAATAAAADPAGSADYLAAATLATSAAVDAAAGSTARQMAYELVEASPHDFYWGSGYDDSGCNHLGKLMMRVRSELLAAHEAQHPAVNGSGRHEPAARLADTAAAAL